jgi:RimJ/RimL family protein N-acetyltransferase
MIRFEIAEPADAEQLRDVQMRAFLSQIPAEKPDLGPPPGADSVEWQIERMGEAPYIKILNDGAIIGGIVLEIEEPDHCHVNRIFLDPPYHGRGIGTQAFGWLERTYPQFHRWTLRTAAFQTRNQCFYERIGYVKTGEMEAFPGFILFEYEKRIELGMSLLQDTNREKSAA